MRSFLFMAFLLVIVGATAVQFGVAQNYLSSEQKADALRLLFQASQMLETRAGTPIDLAEVAQIEKSRMKQIIWLDARPVAERAVSWIPGARPAEGFSTDSFDPTRQLVIVYDTDGSTALPKAKSLNLDKRWRAVVRCLHGGTLAWAQGGRYFQTTKGLSRELRVPSAIWNLAPQTYKVRWD